MISKIAVDGTLAAAKHRPLGLGLLTGAGLIAALAPPLVGQWLFATLVPAGQHIPLLWALGALLFGTVVTVSAGHYRARWLLHQVARLDRQWHRQILRHLAESAVRPEDKAIALRALAHVRLLLTPPLIDSLFALVVALGSVLALAWLDQRMMGFALAVAVLSSGYTLYGLRMQDRAWTEHRIHMQRWRDLAHALAHSWTSLQALHAWPRARAALEGRRQPMQTAAHAAQRQADMVHTAQAGLALLAPLGLLIAFVLVKPAPGQVVALHMAFGQLLMALLMLMSSSNTLVRTLDPLRQLNSMRQRDSEFSGERLKMPIAQLELRAASLCYATQPPVLRDATLALAPGKIVALSGASGSGKSTLLRLMAGLERPDTGNVYLNAQPLAHWHVPALRKRQLGVVLQDMPLAGATLREALAWPPNALTSEQRAWLHQFELDFDLDAPLADDLTIRQRIALLRVVLQQPELLLVDEALDALSAPARAQVWRHVGGGLLISHDPLCCAEADQHYHLAKGRLQRLR